MLYILTIDIINSITRTSFFKTNKFLMNNSPTFIFHIPYVLSFLLFSKGITFFIELKENVAFNIISLIIISIIIIIRITLVIKIDDKNNK